MRNKTLSEIVSGALNQADEGLKLASARDAEPAGDPGDFLASELMGTKRATDEVPFGENTVTKAADKSVEKKASRADIVSDANYAMKIAQALDEGANIIATKLASDGTVADAPGPAVSESGMINDVTKSPKATSSVKETISGGVLGAGGLPTTMPEFTSPKQDRNSAPHNEPGKTAGWTTTKEASARVLRAKLAQAEVLMSLGDDAAAEKILNEVKTASDPSSPQASLPAHNSSFKLDTEPGASTHIGDNASLISMTRSQAKDPTTREATKHFSQSPTKDPAVAAHTLVTTGQKISSATTIASLIKQASAAPAQPAQPAAEQPKVADSAAAREYLARVIKLASDPDASDEDRTKAASAVKSIKAKLGFDPETLLA